MYSKELERLVTISSEVGTISDYVQGGGGNTSYKLSGDMMAVKASGFRLDQITKEAGYVVLDYRQIRDFYKDTVFMSNVDYENERPTRCEPHRKNHQGDDEYSGICGKVPTGY